MKPPGSKESEEAAEDHYHFRAVEPFLRRASSQGLHPLEPLEQTTARTSPSGAQTGRGVGGFGGAGLGAVSETSDHVVLLRDVELPRDLRLSHKADVSFSRCPRPRPASPACFRHLPTPSPALWSCRLLLTFRQPSLEKTFAAHVQARRVPAAAPPARPPAPSPPPPRPCSP
jgi:hypothetical protein